MPRPVASRYAPVAVVLVAVAALPWLLGSNYHLRVASLVFVMALAATGLNLLMGLAGQISLGHAGFVGLGAYAVSVGPTHLGLAGLPSAALGLAASCGLAFVVGRPILKLRGYTLAVATLGCGFLVSMVLTNEFAWTGGPDGMGVPRLVLLGQAVRGVAVWYYVSGITLALGLVLAVNIVDSPTGRALRAINDSEVAARVVGIDVARQKLRIFVVSAGFASVSGSLLAFVNGHVTPDGTSGFLRSIELVTMVVLGGTGSIAGPLVGAAILVVLPQALTAFHEYEHVVLGLVMILCMILLRRGVVPTLAARLRGEGA